LNCLPSTQRHIASRPVGCRFAQPQKSQLCDVSIECAGCAVFLQGPYYRRRSSNNIYIMKSESVAKTEVGTTSPDLNQNAGVEPVSVKGRLYLCHSVPHCHLTYWQMTSHLAVTSRNLRVPHNSRHQRLTSPVRTSVLHALGHLHGLNT